MTYPSAPPDSPITWSLNVAIRKTISMASRRSSRAVHSAQNKMIHEQSNAFPANTHSIMYLCEIRISGSHWSVQCGSKELRLHTDQFLEGRVFEERTQSETCQNPDIDLLNQFGDHSPRRRCDRREYQKRLTSQFFGGISYSRVHCNGSDIRQSSSP